MYKLSLKVYLQQNNTAYINRLFTLAKNKHRQELTN